MKTLLVLGEAVALVEVVPTRRVAALCTAGRERVAVVEVCPGLRQVVWLEDLRSGAQARAEGRYPIGTIFVAA